MAAYRFTGAKHCVPSVRYQGLFIIVLAALGSWVRSVVDLSQVLEIQVSVNLGGGQVCVAEQFLHCPQVAGGFQQVRGEGVA